MKKFFSILAAFFLGLFISISIIACADNDDDSSLGQLSWAEFKELRNARVLNVRYSGGDVRDNLEYKYDDKGRISAAYRKTIEGSYNFSDTYNVTYSGNTIIIIFEGEESERYEVTVSEGAMMVPYVVNEIVRDVIEG
ncbi:MAG: hypothetical protein E7139_01595 [Rikenellaceae bacterium]|nr:hypothetical protein [Rikenellaceae bacterium]